MEQVGYASALLLAAIFAFSGTTKAARRPETIDAFRALRLPRPSALAVLVPLSELVLAFSLVLWPAIGAALALAALAVFSAVLVSRLRAGVVAPCACFGTARTEPLSFVEVARNGLLSLFAVAALGASSPTAPGLPAVVAVTAAAVTALMVLALCDLRHRIGRVWDNHLAGEGR